MKTDLNFLKKELGRLTDVKYLKKELNRIAGEVKKIDVHTILSPAARERLDQLEKRFHEVLATLQQLQKQVDASLDSFLKMVHVKRKATAKRASTNAAVKATKKAAKKTAKSVKKTTRKAAKKVVAQV